MKLQIFDIDNWREIGATLGRNKTRTFLTGFGIFWGVAMLAILMGGSRGAEDMIRRQFAGFATNSGAMSGAYTNMPYKGNPSNRKIEIDLTDVERIRSSVPGLSTIVPVFMSHSAVSCRNGRYTYSGSAQGMEPDYLKVNEPKIYAGRFINEADESGARKVLVLGKKIADELFPGEPFPVGKTMIMNDVSYSIVGIVGSDTQVNLGGRPEEMVMLPSSTFRKAFPDRDKVDFVMFVAKDGIRLSDLKSQILGTVYRRYNIHPDDSGAVFFMDISKEFEKVETLFTGISLLAFFIGFSTLMAGVIGIGNIMWVIVKERTQEIGIRRAIGAKPRDIITQVLCEGIAMTAVAGTAGICFATLALGITHYITNQDGNPVVAHFQMTFGYAVEIMVLFVVLGTLAGLIPSFKAMKIKPIEALNDK